MTCLPISLTNLDAFFIEKWIESSSLTTLLICSVYKRKRLQPLVPMSKSSFFSWTTSGVKSMHKIHTCALRAAAVSVPIFTVSWTIYCRRVHGNKLSAKFPSLSTWNRQQNLYIQNIQIKHHLVFFSSLSQLPLSIKLLEEERGHGV